MAATLVGCGGGLVSLVIVTASDTVSDPAVRQTRTRLAPSCRSDAWTGDCTVAFRDGSRGLAGSYEPEAMVEPVEQSVPPTRTENVPGSLPDHSRSASWSEAFT